jgi:hypothetical protein
MKCKAIIIAFLCVWGIAQAQSGTQPKKSDFGVAFTPGIILQRNVFIDANLFLGKIYTIVDQKIPIVGVNGYRIGIETDCNRRIVPKVGYEFSLLVTSFRFTLADYIQGNQSEFRVIPELGIGIGGWINLTYGYGISLNKANLTDIGHHRLALTINLNKRLNHVMLKGNML